jgi:hypothetical protein
LVFSGVSCKALADAGDDNVLDAVFLLGGVTKCPSFLVAGSRLHVQLARFSSGARFPSLSLDTPSSPSFSLSPPLNPWLLLHGVLSGLSGLLDTQGWFLCLAHGCASDFFLMPSGPLCLWISVKVVYLGGWLG